jgi:DNA polymerase-4
LKVRFGDFTTITRSSTLAVAIDDSRSLLEVGRELLELIDPSQGVRLLGLSVSGLSTDASRQLTFDEALSGPGWQEADRTIDEIRARFGENAIGPALATGPDGLRLKRRGAQQWGPDANQT